MGTRHFWWADAGARLVVVALVAVSCGDDDTAGPPQPPNAALTGDYFVVAYEHDVDADAPLSSTGVVHFDGAGKFAGEVALAFGGPVVIDSILGDYEVGTDRGLTLKDDSGELLSGGLDPSYTTAVLGRIRAGGNPMVGILLRRSGSYSMATLSGTYHVAGIQHESETYAAFTGTAALDTAMGTCQVQATNNWGGSIDPMQVDLDYDVWPTGELVFRDPSNSTTLMRGGVLVGGDMAVAATVEAGGDPRLTVFIRQSGTVTPSTVAASHWYVSMGPQGLPVGIETGVIDFDDRTSSWTTTATQNLNGSIGSSVREGSYIITPDGRLTLTVLGAVEPQLEFGVSTKGQAAAGACITSDVNPLFVVAVRK